MHAFIHSFIEKLIAQKDLDIVLGHGTKTISCIRKLAPVNIIVNITEVRKFAALNTQNRN